MLVRAHLRGGSAGQEAIAPQQHIGELEAQVQAAAWVKASTQALVRALKELLAA